MASRLARVGGVRRHAAPQLCGGPEGRPELWEISYDPAAEPIHDGVHDYRMGESIAKPGGRAPHPLEEPLDDFFFDQTYHHVLGATRPASLRAEGATAQVVNLNIRRKVADLPIAGMPHLGSGITFAWNGTTVLASPNLGAAPLTWWT